MWERSSAGRGASREEDSSRRVDRAGGTERQPTEHGALGSGSDPTQIPNRPTGVRHPALGTAALAASVALVFIPVGGASLAGTPTLSAPSSVALPSRAISWSPPSRTAVPIDTRDKAEVREAWMTRMAPTLNVRPRWSGSERPCRAGSPSAAAQRATLKALNFVRALGGLDPVEFSSDLSARAQKAALIMAANDALSHYPPRSWRCWTRQGKNAAGASNLALAYPALTGGGVIVQYMDDQGTYNTAVGHRRWIMYPFQRRMGSGLTTTSNALYVFGPTNQQAPNPNWVAWPTAGYFPSPLEPLGRWSLSSGLSGTDFSRARVSVTRGGNALDVKVHYVFDGYGQPTLVFEVKNVGSAGVYRVNVTRIRGAGPTSHSYTVRLFQP